MEGRMGSVATTRSVTEDALRMESVRLTEEHAPALRTFFQTVWGDHGPPPSFDTPAFGVLQGDRLVGYVGTLPVRFWDGTREREAWWMKGLMVLPEYRNGPVGFAVMKEAAAHLPLAASLSVAPAARRLFEAVGFRDLGPLENRVALLRPARVLRSLDPKALGLGLPAPLNRAVHLAQRLHLTDPAGALLAGVFAAIRRPVRGVSYESGRPEWLELDRLWRELRTDFPFAAVRDGGALTGRYLADAEHYELLTLRDGPEPVACAVLRHPRAKGDPRLRGIRMAVLADLLAPPHRPDLIAAALAAAEERAHGAGADALLCSTGHPGLRRSLQVRGWLPMRGHVHLLLRTPPDDPLAAGSLTDWWTTRGDGRADENF